MVDQRLLQDLRVEYPRIDASLVSACKKSLTILHPLVRREEISLDVDNLSQAAYFRQARNGVFMRMALLAYILEREQRDGRDILPCYNVPGR